MNFSVFVDANIQVELDKVLFVCFDKIEKLTLGYSNISVYLSCLRSLLHFIFKVFLHSSYPNSTLNLLEYWLSMQSTARLFLLSFATSYILLMTPFLKPDLGNFIQKLEAKISQIVPVSIAVQNPDPADTQGSSSLSRNWSGYIAEKGTFSGVEASWTVPNPKIADSDFGTDAEWIGIGGVSDKDLIQTGTQGTVDSNGNVVYEAFFETLPDPSNPIKMDVNPGDSITASIIKTSENKFTILIKNNTNGQNKSFSVPYNSSLSSAEWIVEAPSGARRILPLDNFGSVTFTDAAAIKDGQKINLASSNIYAVTMGNVLGTLATATPLNSEGSGFTINYSNDTQNQTNTDQFLGRKGRHRIVFRFAI